MRHQKDIDARALEAFDVAAKNPHYHQITSLLTMKERVMLGRRILIAQAILAGKTRMEITNVFQISPNTFAHIRRWLKQEVTCYEPVRSSPSSPQRRQHKSHTTPFSYEDMKRRYPGHFLLISMVETLFKK